MKEARATVEKPFLNKNWLVVELGDREVGLVLKNGKIAGVLAPGRRQLYWRGPIDVRVEVHDIGEKFELAPQLASLLVRAKPPLAALVADAVSAAEVPDTAVGLLIVDGSLAKVLAPDVTGGGGGKARPGEPHQAPRGDGSDPFAAQHRATHG